MRRLGLSAARTRELRLSRGWGRVARGLAVRLPARLRGGVLEVTAPDPAWERALRELMPRLAASLAREEPALGIRSYRLDGPEGRGAVTAIDPAAAIDPGPPGPPRAAGAGRDATADRVPEREELEARLLRLRDRLLERGERRR